MTDAELVEALNGAAEEIRIAHDAKVRETRRADALAERVRELTPRKKGQKRPACSGAECASRLVKGQPGEGMGGLCAWCWLAKPEAE